VNVRELAGPRPVHLPSAFALVGALAVALAGIRGADYPAHLLRAELWERAGSGVWNFTWYGGHATPSYSVLVPPLVATFGPVAVCVVATIVGTYLFSHLVHELTPTAPTLARTLAGVSFAASAVVNVAVGRTTFAVGLVAGIAALLAWQMRLAGLAVVLAVLTPLTSPVVAAFVALAAAAVGLDAVLAGRAGADTRRRVVESALVLAGSVVPLVIMSVLFRDGGRFPFRFGHLMLSLGVMLVAAIALRTRVVHLALGMAAISSVVLFLVPNPLGGNFLRFAQFFVVPLTIVGVPTLPLRWARAAAVLAFGGVVWSVQFGVVATVQWAGDKSVEAEFHAPLIDEIQARSADGKPVGRVEIPFTDNHWEAYFVASELPYARGWERQIDLDRNEELYDPELSRGEYHGWLLHNAVRWVAVPDVDLDEGGEPEGAVLESHAEIPWIDLVWWNGNWRLYEVLDYQPIVDLPARLVSQTPDELLLATDVQVVVTLRYEYSEQLAIDGDACLIPPAEEGEWMQVYLPAAGQYRVTPDPEGLIPGVDPDTCRATANSSLTQQSS
jgi:hypothetical protein